MAREAPGYQPRLVLERALGPRWRHLWVGRGGLTRERQHAWPAVDATRVTLLTIPPRGGRDFPVSKEQPTSFSVSRFQMAFKKQRIGPKRTSASCIPHLGTLLIRRSPLESASLTSACLSQSMPPIQWAEFSPLTVLPPHRHIIVFIPLSLSLAHVGDGTHTGGPLLLGLSDLGQSPTSPGTRHVQRFPDLKPKKRCGPSRPLRQVLKKA